MSFIIMMSILMLILVLILMLILNSLPSQKGGAPKMISRVPKNWSV